MNHGQMTEVFKAAYSCSDVQYHGERGPLNIDYYHLYKCDFNGLEFVFLLLISLWILILINLLAKIASEYFTPTLSSISQKWQLSDNFAGLTLLALANGAPDVFCVIITGNSDLGISALLGGGLFVSSVVVGCIAILCPCKLRGLYFTRDIVFLLISVTAVTVLGIRETVTLPSAISLIVIYITYLLVVLQTPWVERTFFLKNIVESEDALGSVGLDYVKKIEAAQWTDDEEKDFSGEYSEMTTMGPSEAPRTAQNDLIHGYKFTILEDYTTNQSYNEDSRKNRSNTHNENDDKNRNKKDGNQNDGGKRSSSPSENLMSRIFSGKVIEEFYSNIKLISETATASAGNKEEKYSETVLSNDSNKLRESLLSHSSEDNENSVNKNDNISKTENQTENSNENRNENENDTGIQYRIKILKTKLDICFKICFRCGYVRQPEREWSGTILYKIVQIIEMPFVFLMNLTIATCEASSWCKEFAVIQPLLAPFFTLFAFGSVSDIFSIPFLLFYVTFCATTSFCILIFSHHSYPPQQTLFLHVWLIFGFFICIVWLYLLSGELVYCLTSMGRILDIPTFYLGLTILAWGNSIGDLFSDISIAKMGLGEMALAGCYGGPIFNILIGMGTSLTMICYRNHPYPYKLTLDTSAYVSIGFLFVSLISTVLITAFHRFHITAYTGYCLIMLYVTYTLTQTLLAFNH